MSVCVVIREKEEDGKNKNKRFIQYLAHDVKNRIDATHSASVCHGDDAD